MQTPINSFKWNVQLHPPLSISSTIYLPLPLAITMARTTSCIPAAATLALLLFIIIVTASSSTAYQTTITSSVEIDTQHQCSQAHQQIMSCQTYLRESAKLQGGMWREEFPRCCQQLEQVEQQCQCQALKEMVQQQLQDLQYGRKMRGQTWTETLRTASSLPVMCRIPPEQYCEVEGPMHQLV